jgi:ribonuclease T2
MQKLIISALLISLPLISVAKEYKEATKTCEAFNNMKHTKNTNNIKLKVGDEYRVLEHKKGQILTLIKGERIVQRWVDESCFNKQGLDATIKKRLNKTKTSRQNLLAISWQNAFCQTHQYKKECKNMSKKDFGASNFVLHGLWPQPKSNQYCKVDKKQVGMDKNRQWHRLNNLDLTSSTRERLSKLMPGYSSNLHKHEWIKHGTCYGTDASEYYDNAMDLITQINESKVQEFFNTNIGKRVALKDIRKVFDKEFGRGSGEHVTMNCSKGLITELWVHIGNGSDKLKELLTKGETPKSRCHKGRIDAVGY